MQQKSKWFIAISSILLFSSCKGQQKESGIKEKADEYFRTHKVPGLLIGILDNGKRSWYSYGYADPDKKMPFDSATIFEVGSITKTFTAYVLTAVLKEKGMEETRSILPFLPDSVQQNKSLEKISFLSLMNHTSGLERLPTGMDLNSMTPYDNYTLSDLYHYLMTCQPKPDGKSQYSNLGMGLAGVLAERISGKNYYQLLDQYIFIPFKMGKSEKDLTVIGNKAVGYLEGTKAAYWNMAALAPAGNIKSSGSEMLTYLQNISVPANDSAIQTVRTLLQPTTSLSANMQVARGWHILTDNGQEIYWHNGGTYGFSSFAAFKKDGGKAIILIINSFNSDRSGDNLGFSIAQELFK